MKILYFDCWSPKGHLQFNKIHLEALSKIGEVYTVFREGAFADLFIPHVHRLMGIPDKYYLDYSSSFKSRMLLSRMMRFVWRKINANEWDYIILATYDATSLFLSQKFKNAFVIDHNTIADLDNPVKGWFYRHLSKNITHVLFNDDMKRKMDENGIYNYIIVPHGFLPMIPHESDDTFANDFYARNKINKEERLLFIPSLSRASEDLIGRFIYKDDVNSFLKENNLVLFTKSLVERPSMSNIRIINDYLSKEEYEFLFLNSLCIIMLYSTAFKYRTSGVLNECFANQIPCIFNNNEALMSYGRYINNDKTVFSNTEEMKESILSVLSRDNNKPFYQALDEIESPLEAWAKILKPGNSLGTI